METNELRTHQIHENSFAIVSAIIPFSIAGVLIRIAVTRLETYSGSPVFSLVYSQWIGCFIMGICNSNKNAILYWMYPLFTGITSGLCGSITTFSSWQLQMFKEFSNYDSHSHSTGKNILAAISVFLVTLAMSWQAFVLGKQIVFYRDKTPTIEIHSHGYIPRRFLKRQDYGLMLFGLTAWLGVIFSAIWAPTQKSLAFASVFAPTGALLRYKLSSLNASARFPWGTLIANIFGTLVLAVLSLLQSGAISATKLECDVIQGLADGFCGCLTTISTFIVELNTLRLKEGYLYGIMSVVIAQCTIFVVLGPFIWSHGIYNVCTA